MELDVKVSLAAVDDAPGVSCTVLLAEVTTPELLSRMVLFVEVEDREDEVASVTLLGVGADVLSSVEVAFGLNDTPGVVLRVLLLDVTDRVGSMPRVLLTEIEDSVVGVLLAGAGDEVVVPLGHACGMSATLESPHLNTHRREGVQSAALEDTRRGKLRQIWQARNHFDHRREPVRQRTPRSANARHRSRD